MQKHLEFIAKKPLSQIVIFILNNHNTSLFYLCIGRMTDDGHVAYHVSNDVSFCMIEEMNEHECPVFDINLYCGVVADPDITHVRLERIADCCMALTKKHKVS